jgi:hypothetical protein
MMRHNFIYSTLIGSFILSLYSIASHAVCPEIYADKFASRGQTSKIVIETGNGKKLNCKLKNTTKYKLNFVRICPNNISIYSSYDAGDVKIEKNGKVSNYAANFLGDKYQCTSKGQTYIKRWIYRNGGDVIRETSYDYSPYKK